MAIASTASCPSSTPRLKVASAVSRFAPANWSFSRSANENPNPWISPNPNAMGQRAARRSAGMMQFSMPSQTMDAAINVSTSGGNQNVVGTKPSAEAPSVSECATVNAVTMATRSRQRRTGSTRHSRNSR